MALYPFVHVSALELHALSRYPVTDRMTDRNTNRLPYAFAAHAHRGIMNTHTYTYTHTYTCTHTHTHAHTYTHTYTHARTHTHTHIHTCTHAHTHTHTDTHTHTETLTFDSTSTSNSTLYRGVQVGLEIFTSKLLMYTQLNNDKHRA